VSCLDIAHRGASRDAPENTLEAFELAIAQGADMIETDLHLLRDGSVVLTHDARIRRRAVGGLDLGELRELSPSIPTLDEALDAVGDRIPFNLELKRGVDGDYPGLAERALDAVRRRGLLEQTLFSAFYDSALEAVRRLESSARVGLLVSRRGHVAVEERARGLGAEAVHPERAILTERMLRELQGAGYRVNVFTVDAEADLRRLVEWGVDGIFTNVPARLRKILDS
jgi:glycerophosphoryl diester phosphodiesterase